MWPCHKRCSKRNEEGVWCVSYDKRHRSTVGRAFLMRHTYQSWGGIITNGHLLICDWCFRILKGSKM